MKLRTLIAAMTVASISSVSAQASTAVYADFPITVKDYKGDKKTSVSYGGQMARQQLHNALKSLATKGNGKENPELLAQMQSYFSGKEAGRAILAPVSKEGFAIAQTDVDQLSKDKNLAGKAYPGIVSGWPGNKTAAEVLQFFIEKASASDAGFDYSNGMDYPQLISKFAMGAVFYNQAVDSYLDEKLEADTKPNDKPYSEGAAYTGKEHVWDEAFGYFGTPIHTLAIDPASAYNIAKSKPEVFAAADYDKSGDIDLGTEMIYAHAYYAANADSSGKTQYLHTITKAFIDGRQLITDAKGEKLSPEQLSELKAYAKVIKDNWELVIVEATFKYAGSVYSDALKLQAAIDTHQDVKPLFKNYIHHWGELKGFAMALQAGGKDLGALSVSLNRLIGFSPVLLGNTQVTSIDADGNYQQTNSVDLKEYALQMLKLQKVLDEAYDIKARNNDHLASLGELADKLGSGQSTEND